MNKNQIQRWNTNLSTLAGEDCFLTVYINGKYCPLSETQLEYIKGESSGLRFHLRTVNDQTIAQFTLVQMIGCCGICVSTNSYVSSKYRQKGINTELNKLRIELAKDQDYSLLLCTDVATNVPQKKTLLKNGWIDIHRFRNSRTGNLVDISVIPL